MNSAAPVCYPRYKLNCTEVYLEEINKASEWKVTLKNSFSFYFNFTINEKWINEKTKEREEIVKDYYHNTKLLQILYLSVLNKGDGFLIISLVLKINSTWKILFWKSVDWANVLWILKYRNDKNLIYSPSEKQCYSSPLSLGGWEFFFMWYQGRWCSPRHNMSCLYLTLKLYFYQLWCVKSGTALGHYWHMFLPNIRRTKQIPKQIKVIPHSTKFNYAFFS